MSRWWKDGQPYTCKNGRFETDTREDSETHGPAPAKGSVFAEPLVDNDGYTLWLEHVNDHRYGGKMFWLMWYNADGVPQIPASGVFNLDQLRLMSSRLASFIQVPRDA